MKDFRCPVCGFRVFSRSYPFCEGCGKPLPAELLLTHDEMVARAATVEQAFEENVFKRPSRIRGLLGILFNDMAPDWPRNDEWKLWRRRWW